MRSIIAGFLILLPILAHSGALKAPVMYADCQCEITNADGIITPLAQMGFLPGISPAETSGSELAKGQYTLDLEGRKTAFQDSRADKLCAYDQNGDLNAACFFAVVMAKKRAEGDCYRKAKALSDEASGRLVPNSCSYQLEGQNFLDTTALSQLPL